MHLDQLRAPVAPIVAPTVAHRTRSGLGWAALGLAVAVHAVLAGLLLRIHPAAPDAQRVQPVEVTLELAPSAATPPVPAAPPSEPEPQPEPAAAPPEPPAPVSGPQPGPAPDASPPEAAKPADSTTTDSAAPAPASRDVRRPAAQASPSPARHAVKPVARPARPATRPPAADPNPEAAAARPAAPAPPAPVASPPQAAAPVQQATAEAAGAWRNAVAAWLREHRTYPEAARRDGVEGRVVVRFTIDGAGLVTAVALVSGSGSAVLDEAAQALLRGAHLPPPAAPAPDHLSVTLPIRYTLAQ